MIKKLKCIALTCCLAPALLAAGLARQEKEAKKQLPPAPGPARPFSFPKYETRKLANGLTVYVIEDHRQPLVSYNMLINAGGINHSPDKAGLASMTAELLRQGTASRSAQDIARAIDNVGGSLTTSADDDTAEVEATLIKNSADLGIELLADVVLHPAFKQEEIDRLLRQTLSGLQIQYTDPEYLAPASAARLVFGKHPYGYPIEGTPDTLQAIKRDDILQFYRRHYAPQGAFLAISGDITAAEGFAKAEKYLGAWSAGAPASAAAEAPPAPSRSVLIIDKPDAVQTQIVVGHLGIKRNDPDYFALLIANQIFGGSFNSRLNTKLRAREGLTYGARSSFESKRQAGSFEVSTSTRTEETTKSIGMLLELLKEFRQNPATEAEMREAKAYLTGSFTIRAETPGQIASHVLTAAKYGLPADYWDRYRDSVQAVTIEQLAGAVKRHVDPDKMAIVAAGNAKGFAKQLDTMGSARTILFTDLDLTHPDLKRAGSTVPTATREAAAQGLQLINAAAQAVGGVEVLNSVKDIVAKGAATVATPQGELQAEVTLEILYPDKLKLTVSLPAGQMIQGFDGKSAWMIYGPQKMDLPPSMNSEMLQNIQMSAGIGLLREALAGRAQTQALNQTNLDGKPMDTVVWKADTNPVTLLLDPETHLIKKASYRSVSIQGAADVDDLWSDYREVSGLKVPFAVVTYRNGQKSVTIAVKEIQLNTGIDPAKFSKPQQ